MIQAYHFEGTQIQELTFTELNAHLADTVWIDLFNPTEEEEVLIEDLLGIDIPTREEMQRIELSSRLYQHNNTLFATINTITGNTLHSETHAVTFVLHNKWLITVRYVEGLPYNNFIEKVKLDHTLFPKGSFILSFFLEEITEQLADILENATHVIEELNRHIFKYDYASNGTSKTKKPDFKNIISQIGRSEDLLSQTRESLFTITRMLSFILQTSYFQNHENKKITMIMRDITSLLDHATFLSNKTNFLLDATLGMINIEQSSIIKIVSVAAVVFLPPTLVASIYGMNFQYMPELQWYVGYPFAIFLMILSGFLPYKYFKYKGWL